MLTISALWYKRLYVKAYHNIGCIVHNADIYFLNRKEKRHLDKTLIFNSNKIFWNRVYSSRHFHFRDISRISEVFHILSTTSSMMSLKLFWILISDYYHRVKEKWLMVKYQLYFIMNMKRFYKCIPAWQCKFPDKIFILSKHF